MPAPHPVHHIYIEYNEGFVGENWVAIEESELIAEFGYNPFLVTEETVTLDCFTSAMPPTMATITDAAALINANTTSTLSKKALNWIKAAGVRAVKTVAQTAVATIACDAAPP